MHNTSDTKASLDAEVTSIHNFPADFQSKRVSETNTYTSQRANIYNTPSETTVNYFSFFFFFKKKHK